jgi:glucose-6-phosphate 1-dehydrogenase
MRLGQARMEFTYEASFGTQGLEPYERLMYDAMLGDRTLFTDAEGIESLWAASRVRWSKTHRRCTATRPAHTGRRRCTS